MRFSYFLVVAAVAVLTSCDAASATTDTEQTKIANVDVTPLVHTVDSVSGKRLLRSYNAVDEDDEIEASGDGKEEDDGDEEEEEERWKMPKTPAERFAKWLSKDKEPSTIKVKLGITDSTPRDSSAWKLYQAYWVAWLKKYPSGIVM